MILADTSIWVDHLHRADPVLYRLFHSDRILTHPVVIGEVALGRLVDRPGTLRILRKLPQAEVAGHEEVLQLVEAGSSTAAGSVMATRICWRLCC